MGKGTSITHTFIGSHIFGRAPAFIKETELSVDVERLRSFSTEDVINDSVRKSKGPAVSVDYTERVQVYLSNIVAD